MRPLLALAVLLASLVLLAACGAPFQAGEPATLTDAGPSLDSTPPSEASSRDASPDTLESPDSGPADRDAGALDAAARSDSAAVPGCTPIAYPLAPPPDCAASVRAPAPYVWLRDVNCWTVPLDPACACQETFDCRCLAGHRPTCMQGAGCYEQDGGPPFLTCQ
jgi:hypothetical protein